MANIISDNVEFLTDKFKVTVKENGIRNEKVKIALLADGTTNNITLPPEIYREYDGLGMGTKTLKTYYANIEFENAAVIEIECSNTVDKLKVSPLKYSEAITFTGNKATINVDKNANSYLEPNGDIFGGIHVFCTKKASKPKITKNFIEFTEGVYTAENCEYIRFNEFGTPVVDITESNTTVFINNGATVNAAFVLNNVKNVKICGSGEISLLNRCHGAKESFTDERFWGAFRKNALPNVYVKNGCENIEIEGVVLNCEFRGICVRNGKNVTMRNVKIFTSTENADGINCVNASDIIVDGCYVYSADDCFCMYDSCDSIPWLNDAEYEKPDGICKNAEIKNCTMASNARPFVLGGHATGSKTPRCEISDIYVHDCEITYTPYRIFGNTAEYANYWSGLMRILSQSAQSVKNITFENMVFNVTKGHNGKAVHIEVRAKKSASYAESEGYKIENIKFKNIKIQGNTENMVASLIKCGIENAKDCGVYGVVFENFTVAGLPITDKQISEIGNVSDIEFLNRI